MTQKIETGCYAVVRANGQPVQVGKRYQGYSGLPATYLTDCGEYQASELRRIATVEFFALSNGLQYQG